MGGPGATDDKIDVINYAAVLKVSLSGGTAFVYGRRAKTACIPSFLTTRICVGSQEAQRSYDIWKIPVPILSDALRVIV